MAFTELLSGIPPDLASLIIHLSNAKAIWDTLRSRLQGTAKTREKRIEQALMDYESFKLESNESIKNASNRFTILLGKLNEGKLPDAPDRINRSEYEQNAKFFHALGDEWYTSKLIMQQTDRLTQLNFSEFIGYLLAQEQTIKNRQLQDLKTLGGPLALVANSPAITPQQSPVPQNTQCNPTPIS